MFCSRFHAGARQREILQGDMTTAAVGGATEPSRDAAVMRAVVSRAAPPPAESPTMAILEKLALASPR
jgi:hypothetical protein